MFCCDSLISPLGRDFFCKICKSRYFYHKIDGERIGFSNSSQNIGLYFDVKENKFFYCDKYGTILNQFENKYELNDINFQLLKKICEDISKNGVFL